MSGDVESGPTVLVVDDLDEARLLLSHWLEMRGYRVVKASDGQQAVETALRESPKLITDGHQYAAS